MALKGSGRHSSVDSSPPSILRSRIRIPSSRLRFYIYTLSYGLYIIALRKYENKQKEARFGPFFNSWLASINLGRFFSDVFDNVLFTLCSHANHAIFIYALSMIFVHH